MSERQFGGYQRELELHGRIDNSDSRESFYSNLMVIYELVVDFDDDYWEDDEDADPNDMFRNYTSLTPEVLEHIRTGIKIDGESASGEIDFMFDMLEGGDMNDSFGTEGWRHRLGWDE
ncbi:hypothetical protein pEaSNUABM50_00080 [Erwinia phage pEa_SNUABM_50]|uniref:Uncharacterized protein n=4 Tax=Eneladusvirus BF TaxID=2560751 RepID=A0A7L8ZM67_9CAUD|nr:hypothetical protein FDH34_gp082 [Serratia phage BF]QOI71020.1 hypothetical protein pEaSNUABM12_00082 [Erwinia phage pEa_SNUABM_12]QOI71565.1 hypothetical protein pEaSNUABM47_00081 [Erwinia phage pEa_SNUABM_47]QOI72104.1 hypothetical protein pEaSNUABM50_00080 [Erwinia phage pEa_SNUABM_50]QXO11229.1 hypothetical protein pEaSNUABM19_00083 [Erwinia phage pEa_SNUABM_19]QXO11777.1 hypothetical protein pEaSNUABM44_00081 [Erwinia phage pEa_SNUABM_44]QXO12329.1 hypothetical protein pEaSNUABM49_000